MGNAVVVRRAECHRPHASYLSATVAGMVQDTWATRDLPVLKAVVELFDGGEWRVGGAQVAERTGLAEDVVQRAFFALANEDPPLFKYIDTSSLAGPEIGWVYEPSGEARRRVGAWPTPESLADRLVQAMDQVAESEPDEEKRSKLRNAAVYLGSAGRDMLVQVAATAVSRGMVAS